MKTTYAWIKRHLDTQAAGPEMADALTHLGFPTVWTPVPKFGDTVVVARVLSCEPHPNADSLKLLSVDIGAANPLQIVCRHGGGVCADFLGILALPGARLPGQDKLRATKIRGVESHGMMCSAKELKMPAALWKGAEGVAEWTFAAAPGTALDTFFANDGVLDLEVTYNRGDCLSVRGIARELSAKGLGTLKPTPDAPFELKTVSCTKTPTPVSVSLEAGCSLYGCVRVSGLENLGETPWAMRKDMVLCGLTALGPVVDVTNYLCHDRGQPLHAYDAEALGAQVSVRFSTPDEPFLGLDGKDYVLSEKGLVVAAQGAVVALAGILGGFASAWSSKTSSIVLEAAVFDREWVGCFGRALRLSTASQMRGERGLDLEQTVSVLCEAAAWIATLCGGTLDEPTVVGAPDPKAQPVFLSPEHVANRTGVQCALEDIDEIFKRLGAETEATPDGVFVTSPSWRHDLKTAVDWVEETVRVKGYEHIPSVPLSTPAFGQRAQTLGDRRHDAFGAVRRFLAAQGLFEVVTSSFASTEQAAWYQDGAPIRLSNFMHKGKSVLRPVVGVHFLSTVAFHQKRRTSPAGFFELGPTFSPHAPERWAVGGLIPLFETQNWNGPKADDVWTVRALVEGIADLYGLHGAVENASTYRWLHPTRQAVLKNGSEEVARFGELHPALAESEEVSGRWGWFEVSLSAEPVVKNPRAFAVSPFPSMERDVSFWIDRNAEADPFLKSLRACAGPLCARVVVFDRFEHADRVSLAVRLTFRSQDRTLTDADVLPLLARFEKEVEEMGGVMRL